MPLSFIQSIDHDLIEAIIDVQSRGIKDNELVLAYSLIVDEEVYNEEVIYVDTNDEIDVILNMIYAELLSMSDLKNFESFSIPLLTFAKDGLSVAQSVEIAINHIKSYLYRYDDSDVYLVTGNHVLVDEGLNAKVDAYIQSHYVEDKRVVYQDYTTLGNALRERRESYHLSVSDVEDKTGIPQVYLDAIEESDFEFFRNRASALYLEPFVKRYGKYLALNVDDILSMLNEDVNNYNKSKLKDAVYVKDIAEEDEGLDVISGHAHYEFINDHIKPNQELVDLLAVIDGEDVSVNDEGSGKEIESDSFSRLLLEKIEDLGYSDSQVYVDANVSKAMFGHIKSDVLFKASKQSVLSFIIGLKLDLEQSNELLESAGYTWSTSNLRDVIVKYFVEHHQDIPNYSIFLVNEVLQAKGCKVLGK